jgi:hypothetical protein
MPQNHAPDHSEPCVIHRVPPGLEIGSVLYRLGENDGPELVIHLERPLNLETLQRLASHKSPAALIEEALDQERRVQENLAVLERKAQGAAQA